MSFTGHQNQVIPASAVSDIPSSLLSKRQMKAMASRNQIVEVQASNGSSQQASGTISFNLSTGSGNGYMRGGSAYLRFDLAPQGTVADVDVAFNGTSASESGSCASLFRTLNINVGGLVLEQINDYDKYYRIIQAHSTNATYVQHDANITEMTTPAPTGKMTANVAPLSALKTTFCVPILSGLLNQEQHLPMWLMNSQLQIQLNLNSAVEAMFSTTGLTNFVIENPVLVYEKIHVDNQFEQAVRAKLASGALYELPYYTALSYRSSIAGAGDYNQNIGVNLSSVCAVLHAHISAPSSNTSKPFFANNSNLKGAGSNRIVRVDGEQVVQSQITSSPQVFNELQRSLGSLYDTNQTSVATRATYDTEYFVNGQGCQRFSDADLCMKGRPANNLVIEEKACAGASTIYAYVIYESVLMVDANGGCVVSK